MLFTLVISFAMRPKLNKVDMIESLKLALEAARKAKFTEGEREQIGSITYNFKLN